jgi:hypothetical protein
MSGFFDIQRGDMTMEAFKSGLEPLAGSAKAEYAAGIITDVLSGAKGDAELYKALYVVFASETDASYSTDSTGEYCYCQTDGFMPTNGTKQIVTSAPWVYHDGGYGNCAAGCALNCAIALRNDVVAALAFRAAVVGALEAVESGGICAANTINIDWNPDNNGAHIKNMCTYDGSITVPADPVKPGYTFTGWKLVE